MKIKFFAMTLQTAANQPTPKEVFGIPTMTNKGTFYMEQFKKCICSKTNSFHKEGEIFLSRSSYLINKNTLKISINDGDFEEFEFENYIT